MTNNSQSLGILPNDRSARICESRQTTGLAGDGHRFAGTEFVSKIDFGNRFGSLKFAGMKRCGL